MLTHWAMFVIDGESRVFFRLMQCEVSALPLLSFPMHWNSVFGIIQFIGYVEIPDTGPKTEWTRVCWAPVAAVPMRYFDAPQLIGYICYHHTVQSSRNVHTNSLIKLFLCVLLDHQQKITLDESLSFYQHKKLIKVEQMWHVSTVYRVN